MAKIMLYREVLKKFGQLPSKTQKKVFEFIRKFQEDSTQASLHLEHYREAVDSKVRSARIGDDYRAIVIAPEQGDIFLLMHIDHHDEAYEWCRNKHFETHQSLGVLQVFDVQQVEAVAEAVAHGPVALTDFPLDELSDDELFLAGVPRVLIPAVRAIRSYDALQEFADYLPKEAAQVLFGIVSGMDLDAALREMLGAGDEAVEPPAGPGDFSRLDQRYMQDLVLVDDEASLRAILAEDIEAWRVFLHPYQRKLVEWRTTGPMKVSGAAGTGKTVALMHRAVHLAEALQGKKEKVLITTFSANLALTIEHLIQRLAPSVSGQIEVTHLNQLARTICMRAGWQGKIADEADLEFIWEAVFANRTIADFEPAFIREEFDLVIDRMGIDGEESYLTAVRSGRPRLDRKQRREVYQVFTEFKRLLNKRGLMTFDGVIHQARLVVEKGGFLQYRHVLVDELQDFSLESLRLIASIAPLKSGGSDPLCLFGDGHQRIYHSIPIPLSRAGIDVRGRSRRLKINYRTSEQIRQWAQGLLQGVAIDDLDGGKADTSGDVSVFRGPLPEVEHFDDALTRGARAVEWVQKLAEQSGYGLHEICVTPVDELVRNVFDSNGIRTLELMARQADPGQLEPGVRFGAMKRIKGLEFKAVVLLLPDGECQTLQRFERYVAATRARERLLVLAGGG